VAGKPLKITKTSTPPHKELIFTKPEVTSRRGRPPTRWLDSKKREARILEIKLEDQSEKEEQLRQSEHNWA
jgi:hypothetical protein